jgi:hypothetical protein
VGPRASLDGRKMSPHRDSFTGSPARSQSLYGLSYLAHSHNISSIEFNEACVEHGAFCLVVLSPRSLYTKKCFNVDV